MCTMDILFCDGSYDCLDTYVSSINFTYPKFNSVVYLLVWFRILIIAYV